MKNEIRLRHTVLLHNAEELDDDLGAWSDQDLSLSGLLGIVDGIERIVEDGGLNPFCRMEILKSSDWILRCLWRLYVSLHGL